jgi:hypothetical protein
MVKGGAVLSRGAQHNKQRIPQSLLNKITTAPHWRSSNVSAGRVVVVQFRPSRQKFAAIETRLDMSAFLKSAYSLGGNEMTPILRLLESRRAANTVDGLGPGNFE